jgi:hypothetical protein
LLCIGNLICLQRLVLFLFSFFFEVYIDEDLIFLVDRGFSCDGEAAVRHRRSSLEYLALQVDHNHLLLHHNLSLCVLSTATGSESYYRSIAHFLCLIIGLVLDTAVSRLAYLQCSTIFELPSTSTAIYLRHIDISYSSSPSIQSQSQPPPIVWYHLLH